MKRQQFNNYWKMNKGAGTALESVTAQKPQEVSVTIPHDAMILNKRQKELPYGNCVGYFPYETVHYTKTFQLEKTNCVYLKFEGVYMNYSVFVNDCLAGQHINGYTPLLLDISPFVRIGENNLKVIVRNGVPSSRWYTGTGIYRDVHLYQGEQIHIAPDGVRLTTLQAEQDLAVVRIETDIRSVTQAVTDVKVRHEIMNDKGEVVAQTEYPVTVLPAERKTASCRIEIENPKLWNVDSPNLYTCVTTVQWGDQEDEQIDRFGIRTLQLDTRHGLRINGIQAKLRGGCIHHDLGIVGAASFKKLEQRRIRAMKAAGYNAIRSAHFPASKTLLEVCDEEGMLVMNEFSDAWTSGKTDFDYAAFFPGCWEEDAQALVKTSYNHPSVVMYSIGNEILECANRIDVQWGKKIADKIRSLDDTRYITNGINLPLSMMKQIPAMAAKEGMISSPTEINTLLNGGMAMIRKLMASKSVGEAIDEACSHLDIVGHNYATYRYEPDMKYYPHRVMVGSETYPGALDANWEMVEKYPQVLGDFSWTAWDYLGEAGIASILYGGETPAMYGPYPWKSAYVGDFDLIGDRRPISYWREIIWGKREAPYIAVQNPAHFGEEQHSTQWGWTDAERCWNWQGYEGKPVTVQIYTSAEEVELKCNGISVGKAAVGTEKKYIAKFQILLFRINCKLQKRKYAKMPAIGQRFQITRAGKPPVNVILHPPKNQSGKAPVFVQIHGGAWVGLDAVMDEEYCQRICDELGAYVVNINYKKLNEKPFPYQQTEVVDTVKWLIANAQELNIAPNRIVISGGSAGGHITAGAAIMLAEEGIQIAGQIMEVPFLDFISGTSDEKENTWDLARQLLEEFSKELPMDHRIVSPLRAPDEVLKKVCPAVVIVCGRDILHEQGQAYAARLEALGVDTQLKMYENGTHGFGVDDSLPEDAKQAQPILREECYQYKKEMMQYLWNKAMERT